MKTLKYIFAALTIVGIFLPWYSFSINVLIATQTSKLTGFQGQSWGTLVLISTILTIAFDFLPKLKRYSFIPMLFGVLFAIIASLSSNSLNGMVSSNFGMEYNAQLSFGIFITLICAIISAFFFFKDKEDDPISLW